MTFRHLWQRSRVLTSSKESPHVVVDVAVVLLHVSRDPEGKPQKSLRVKVQGGGGGFGRPQRRRQADNIRWSGIVMSPILS